MPIRRTPTPYPDPYVNQYDVPPPQIAPPSSTKNWVQTTAPPQQPGVTSWDPNARWYDQPWIGNADFQRWWEGQNPSERQGKYTTAISEQTQRNAPYPRQQWEMYQRGLQAPLIPANRQAPTLGGGVGYGGGGFDASSFYEPLEPFTYDPFSFNFQNVEFTQPDPFTYDPFAKPTLEEAQSEPGYDFRMGQGQKAVENAAAARGLLRSGGTMRDIMEYGQNFGEAAYQNVYDRNFNQWNANRNAAADQWKTNYQRELDRYQAAYGAEQDRFNRAMQAWSGNLGASATGYGFGMDAAAQMANARYQAASLGLQQQGLYNAQMQNNMGYLQRLGDWGLTGTENQPPPAFVPPGSPTMTAPPPPGATGVSGRTAVARPQRTPVQRSSGSGQFGIGGQSIYADPYGGYGQRL